MPAVRKYIVRQTREVEVKGSSPTEAIKAAELPFLMSEEDTRHPIPVETDIRAELVS